MTPDSEDRCLEWAAQDSEHEVCGVVIDGEAYKLRNSSKTPKTDFSIEPSELARAINRLPKGADWTGVWHSHPAGRPTPSEEDLVWHPPGKTLYIVAQGLVLAYEVIDGVAVRHSLSEV